MAFFVLVIFSSCGNSQAVEGTVTGTVLNEQGLPIAQAAACLVYWEPHREVSLCPVATDKDGLFQLQHTPNRLLTGIRDYSGKLPHDGAVVGANLLIAQIVVQFLRVENPWQNHGQKPAGSSPDTQDTGHGADWLSQPIVIGRLITLPFIRSHIASSGVLKVVPVITALIGRQQMAIAIRAAAGVACINRWASEVGNSTCSLASPGS